MKESIKFHKNNSVDSSNINFDQILQNLFTILQQAPQVSQIVIAQLREYAKLPQNRAAIAKKTINDQQLLSAPEEVQQELISIVKNYIDASPREGLFLANEIFANLCGDSLKNPEPEFYQKALSLYSPIFCHAIQSFSTEFELAPEELNYTIFHKLLEYIENPDCHHITTYILADTWLLNTRMNDDFTNVLFEQMLEFISGDNIQATKLAFKILPTILNNAVNLDPKQLEPLIKLSMDSTNPELTNAVGRIISSLVVNFYDTEQFPEMPTLFSQLLNLRTKSGALAPAIAKIAAGDLHAFTILCKLAEQNLTNSKRAEPEELHQEESDMRSICNIFLLIAKQNTPISSLSTGFLNKLLEENSCDLPYFAMDLINMIHIVSPDIEITDFDVVMSSFLKHYKAGEDPENINNIENIIRLCAIGEHRISNQTYKTLFDEFFELRLKGSLGMQTLLQKLYAEISHQVSENDFNKMLISHYQKLTDMLIGKIFVEKKDMGFPPFALQTSFNSSYFRVDSKSDSDPDSSFTDSEDESRKIKSVGECTQNFTLEIPDGTSGNISDFE